MKPLWFGPEERPLFGRLHVPEGGHARGGVLLCPTLGAESIPAQYAYKRMADRLADEGFATLSFDYDGSGDSAGEEDDPGRVVAWLESVRVAFELVRSLELGRISVVGMRMGATVAAETFGRGPAVIDDLVLWDPCASGRAFLREQGALGSFVLGAKSNDDGSIETPGLVYDRDTVADLSALAISNGDGPMAQGVLVLLRSSRKGDRRMMERLALPHAEHAAVAGQEELLNVLPMQSTVPVAAVESIVAWLATRAAGSPAVSIEPDAVGRSRAVVGVAPDGATIVERPLSLGPVGLFGIETYRTGTASEGPGADAGAAIDDASRIRRVAPTIIFFNHGVDGHIGPGRMWVQLSRAWAEEGFRAVRCDISGLGDSPVRAGQRSQVVFPPEALDDVRDVLGGILTEDPSNAVLVGLCSGAYHALEGAIAYKVRGLCVVNPTYAFNPEKVGRVASESTEDSVRPDRPGSSGRKSWATALMAHHWLVSLSHRLPSAVWWVINRTAYKTPPARTLSKAVEAGGTVFVVCGSNESIVLKRGEGGTLRRLARTGRFRLDIRPGLEHSLLEFRSRELVARLFTEHLLATYGGPALKGEVPPKGLPRVAPQVSQL